MKKSYKDNLFRFKCPRKNTQSCVCVCVCVQRVFSFSLSLLLALFLFIWNNWNCFRKCYMVGRRKQHTKEAEWKQQRKRAGQKKRKRCEVKCVWRVFTRFFRYFPAMKLKFFFSASSREMIRDNERAVAVTWAWILSLPAAFGRFTCSCVGPFEPLAQLPGWKLLRSIWLYAGINNDDYRVVLLSLSLSLVRSRWLPCAVKLRFSFFSSSIRSMAECAMGISSIVFPWW
jgi:hypothetical protein